MTFSCSKTLPTYPVTTGAVLRCFTSRFPVSSEA